MDLEKQSYQMQKKGFEDIAKGIKALKEVKPYDISLPDDKPITIHSKTPKYKVDYFTPEEQAEFVRDIMARIRTGAPIEEKSKAGISGSKEKQIYQMQKKGFEDIAKEIDGLKEVKPYDVNIPDDKSITIYGKRGPKGDPGKDGKNPQYQVDYFTPEEQSIFVQDITARIRVPKDGLPGKDAIPVDYSKVEAFVKKEVAKIPKPKNVTIDYDSIITAVLKEIPKPKKITIDYAGLKDFCLEEIRKIENNRESRVRTFNSAGPTTRLGEISDVNVQGITAGQILQWNGTQWVAVDNPETSDVDSVTNSDGTITISPTTGAVVASRPAITGDVAIAGGSNTSVLATVNANVGSFGSATQVGTFTVNGKGLITAASNVTVTPAVGSITGLGTGVATALGVNVGSAGAFITFNGAGGTPSSMVGTNITGTASGLTAGTVTSISGNDHNSLGNLTVGDVHTQYAFLAGRAGGQTVYGGTASGENLTLLTTSNATKGKIFFGGLGTSVYDEVNDRWGFGTASPTYPFHITGTDRYNSSSNRVLATFDQTLTADAGNAVYSNIYSPVTVSHTANPASALAVRGSWTNVTVPGANSTVMPNVSLNGGFQLASYSGTGEVGTITGMSAQATSAGSGATGNINALSATATLTGTAGASQISGGAQTASVSGAATVATITAGSLSSSLTNAGATVTTMQGGSALATLGAAATITTIEGFRVRFVNSGAGTATSAFGVRLTSWGNTVGAGTLTSVTAIDVGAITNTGTMGTVKGVAVASLTGAGTHTNVPYGFYQSGASDYNSFLGNTIIGDSTAISIPTANSSLTIVNKGVANSQLVLRSQRAAIVSTNVLGGIDFQSNDTNLTAPGTVTASIKAIANVTHTASALGTDLAFSTMTGTTLSEQMRILGDGTTLFGSSVSYNGSGGFARKFQFYATTGLGFGRYSADAFAPGINFVKSRSATVGTHSVITTGDLLGQFDGAGSDGTSFFIGAQVLFASEGTIGVGIIPGNIQLRTADSAGALATRAAVNSSGNFGVGTDLTISARIHSLSTTEQLRLGYDASNYFSTTVGSTGGVTFNAVGTGSSFTFSDSISLPYLAITALRTLDNTDYTVDCTANSFTVTLPTAVGIQGRIYNIKNSGTGTITIATTSSQTIDGAASATITLAQYENLTVQSTNANWIIL